MAVSFFGGQSEFGRPRLVAARFVEEDLDREQLIARIRELESLCTEVLVAGVDLGMPQRLLNQLWGAVGHGELPHAFNVDLPPAPSKSVAPAAPAANAAPPPPLAFLVPAPGPLVAAGGRETESSLPEAVLSPGAPLPIPDISLTTNPLTSARADDSRPPPKQAELRPLGVRKTVAVVDDDPMMLDVLARILQRENFELLMASGGPEIIQKLSDHDGDVDLLVTDYAMPDMRGRELADHVRQRFPALKVLYQTGFSDMLFENRVELEEGAAFLEKPFTARGLREAARLVLFGSINP